MGNNLKRDWHHVSQCYRKGKTLGMQPTCPAVHKRRLSEDISHGVELTDSDTTLSSVTWEPWTRLLLSSSLMFTVYTKTIESPNKLCNTFSCLYFIYRIDITGQFCKQWTLMLKNSMWLTWQILKQRSVSKGSDSHRSFCYLTFYSFRKRTKNQNIVHVALFCTYFYENVRVR